MEPYEVFYGQQPPSFFSYLPSISKVQEVETLIHNHQLTLVTLKDNLAMAENCMKQHVDKHHSKRSF